jgi:hypothetical protein
MATIFRKCILKGEKGIAGLSEEARLLLEEEGRARNFFVWLTVKFNSE